jgi:ABC-type lipoprotein export system ATPase subunit
MRKDNPGMTVVVITHDERFGQIADRVVDIKELNQALVLGDGQGDSKIAREQESGKARGEEGGVDKN